MENPTLNKNSRELKTECIEWKIKMLEVAKTCFSSYLITKDLRFFELGKEMTEESNKWDYEAQSHKTL